LVLLYYFTYIVDARSITNQTHFASAGCVIKNDCQQFILIPLSQGFNRSVVCSAFPYSCLLFSMCKFQNTLFFAVFPADKVSPYSLCLQRCTFIRYISGLITPLLLITSYLVHTGPATTTFSLSI